MRTGKRGLVEGGRRLRVAEGAEWGRCGVGPITSAEATVTERGWNGRERYL